MVVQPLSRVQLLVTPWTVAHQALLSMGFPRQEYWSGIAISFSRGSSHPGIKPPAPALQVDSLPLRHQGSQKLFQPSKSDFRKCLFQLKKTCVQDGEHMYNFFKLKLKKKKKRLEKAATMSELS